MTLKEAAVSLGIVEIIAVYLTPLSKVIKKSVVSTLLSIFIKKQ